MYRMAAILVRSSLNNLKLIIIAYNTCMVIRNYKLIINSSCIDSQEFLLRQVFLLYVLTYAFGLKIFRSVISVISRFLEFRFTIKQ